MTESLIRPVGPFDLQLLAALHARCFTAPWDQVWSAASFAEILAMPGAAGWLIAMADQPQGFVITRSVVDEMEIILIAIDPLHQRQGLGGRLLEAACAAARAQGVQAAFLEQAAPNLAARALYLGHGFAEIGRRRAYYHGRSGETADALVLRRQLVP